MIEKTEQKATQLAFAAQSGSFLRACGLAVDISRQRRWSEVKTSHGKFAEELHGSLRSFSSCAPHFKEMSAEPVPFFEFDRQVRCGEGKGCLGHRIKCVINVEISCSAVSAIFLPGSTYGVSRYRHLFLTTVAGVLLAPIRAHCNGKCKFTNVSTKSFMTRKATMNADPVDQWHFGSAIVGTDREKHLVAVSDNPVVIEIFGIPEENLFRFWDWVGSIFSVWGAIVHSAQINLAKFFFEECLHGVEEIGKHSLTDPLEQNIPAILALIECQNSAELGVGALCVLPYDKLLNTVVPWRRQLTMESFGKASTFDNKSLRTRTRLPVWSGTARIRSSA